MFLCDDVVPALQERNAVFVVNFMQDRTLPYTASEHKSFLLRNFTEDA